MKKLLIMFVLSLMTVLFAGCADEKREQNIVYEKDNNTNTGTDVLPENITYSITVDSVSLIDKTDNTSEWRFLPSNNTDPLESVFADILGRPDNESDNIMRVTLNQSHLIGEAETGPCYGRPCGYYDNTFIRVYFCKQGDSCYYISDSIYLIEIKSDNIRDYKILFNYVKEQILNNPYENRYKEHDSIIVKTSE